MDKITVYSTGCPKCERLEERLNQNNINYIVESDEETLSKLGIEFVPCVELSNGTRMGYVETIEWLKGLD